ncbi:MAG: SgcJ/EcaC family oxidoreductase [Rhodanobacter sp.]
MQTTKLFALASVLALMALPLLAANAPDSANACWQPAFVAGDADAVAKCYAPDAVFWLPGSPTMRGRAAIRAGYAGFFAEARIKSAKLVEMGRVTQGSETSSWGSFTLVSVSKKDGKETTEHGRYTDVSRKVDGRWMYLVDHASDDPPAAPAH